jgi:hypothetical protein
VGSALALFGRICAHGQTAGEMTQSFDAKIARAVFPSQHPRRCGNLLSDSGYNSDGTTLRLGLPNLIHYSKHQFQFRR